MTAARVQRLQLLLTRVQERRRVLQTDRESGEVLVGQGQRFEQVVPVVESEPPMEIDLPGDLRSSAPPYDPVSLTDPAPRPSMSGVPARHSQRPDQPSPISARPGSPVAESSPTLELAEPDEPEAMPFGSLIARSLMLRPKR